MYVSCMLRYFDKNSEELIGEIKLPDTLLRDLQREFEIDRSNPMYDSYPIDSGVIEFVSTLGVDQIDLSRYDYFLETVKRNSES